MKPLIIARMMPAIFFILLASSCRTIKRPASSREQGHWSASRPNVGAEEARSSAKVPEQLTLAAALELAEGHNPALAARSAKIDLAAGRISQAGNLPNPTLEWGVGEIDRAGAGYDSAESEIALSQVIELGGKRARRKQVAELGSGLARQDYLVARLAVRFETERRFYALLAAQRRLALNASALDTAQKTAKAVVERVEAGKERPLQASKAEADLEIARLRSEKAETELESARARLTAMWGGRGADFKSPQGSLTDGVARPPEIDALRDLLQGNPLLLRQEKVIQRAEAVLRSEKARRIPDMEISAGYERFEEDGTDSYAFGIGMPLPIFDRNGGNIDAAYHELLAERAEARSLKSQLAAELAETHGNLSAAYRRVETFEQKVVPATEEAYESSRVGYSQGKLGFLDMLDAQRSLCEARAALADALENFHQARIDLQELTAGTKNGFE